MNITLTGATGFVGARLTRALLEAGHAIHALGRKRPANLPLAVRFSVWRSAEAEPPSGSLAGANAVIHLAGEPVAQRWTPEAKKRIRGSRVDGTRLKRNCCCAVRFTVTTGCIGAKRLSNGP